MSNNNTMNITEYVIKNRAKTLDKLPLNPVDSLILSQLSYLKYEGIPELYIKKDGITIQEVAKSKYVKNLFIDERYAASNKELFDAVAESKRFGTITIKDFVNIIDDDWKIQFCAMTCVFENGTTYVVFRGTDDNLVGWQEDLDMIYKTPIPAQEKSVWYLNRVAKKIKGNFYVGGHSKGGNLAVYSSMKVSKGIQDKIIRIFSHDGPGFKPEELSGIAFARIEGKILKLVPKSSIVGMLLTTKEHYEVVACHKIGISQHNPFNWIVEKHDFQRVDQVDKASEFQNQAINLWVLNLTDEQGEYLSTQLFDIFEKAGITNLNDMQSNLSGLITSLRNLATTMNELDPETKNRLEDIFKMLSDMFFDVMKENMLDNMNSTLENAKVVVDNVIENVHKKSSSGNRTLKKRDRIKAGKNGDSKS